MRLAMLTPLFFIIAGCESHENIAPANRTWMDRTISFSDDGGPRSITVKGDWPNATSDLWIRYRLSLVANEKDELLIVAHSIPIPSFEQRGAGTPNYTAVWKRLGQPTIFYALFDYEIWDDKPEKGTLLCKESLRTALTQTTTNEGAKANPFTSVQDAVTFLDAYKGTAADLKLLISDSLLDPTGVNMVVITDSILAKEFLPDGFEQKDGYRVYQYKALK